MTQEVAPPRTVGFWGSALFQINGMIGSGIFALPAVLAAAVGTFAPVMIMLGGVVFLPIVLTFAWLAARYDGTGGPVLYGRDAFGSFAGFQAGWGRYAAGIASLAANTHVMVAYFAAVFPVLAPPAVATATVVATILLFTAISVLGMRGSVRTLGVLTVLKLVPLTILVASAAFGGFSGQPVALPQFSDTEAVILLLFYAFVGFENVTVPAGEVRDPQRRIPRVLLTVLAGVTAIYVLVIWAYLAIDPPGEAAENALAGAAAISLGQWGSLMIVMAAAFSIAANGFTTLVVVPRLAFGMAEQGMLPAWFARVHARFLTPANSIVFFGAVTALLAAAGGFALLAAASTLTRMLTYAISAAALPAIERRAGGLVPLHTVMAALALAASIWIASHADAKAWLIFAVLIGAGTVLYLSARRRARRTGQAA